MLRAMQRQDPNYSRSSTDVNYYSAYGSQDSFDTDDSMYTAFDQHFHIHDEVIATSTYLSVCPLAVSHNKVDSDNRSSADVGYYDAGNWNTTYDAFDTFDDEDSDDDCMVIAAFDQNLNMNSDGMLTSTYLTVVNKNIDIQLPCDQSKVTLHHHQPTIDIKADIDIDIDIDM